MTREFLQIVYFTTCGVVVVMAAVAVVQWWWSWLWWQQRYTAKRHSFFSFSEDYPGILIIKLSAILFHLQHLIHPRVTVFSEANPKKKPIGNFFANRRSFNFAHLYTHSLSTSRQFFTSVRNDNQAFRRSLIF